VLHIPVKDDQGVEQFKMNYQHDLMIEVEGDLKAIGSVKTSSKDRIDKVFIDKFLYNRLTDALTPHFAMFKERGKSRISLQAKPFCLGILRDILLSLILLMVCIIVISYLR